MTRPYKVSLIIAVLLCCGMLLYYFNVSQPRSDRQQADLNNPATHATATAGFPPQDDGHPSERDGYSPGIKKLLTAFNEHPESQPRPDANARGTRPAPVNNPKPAEPEPPTLTLGSTEVQPTFPPHRSTDPAPMLQVTGRHATTPTHSRYTIKPGDTFSSIAVRVYGSERYWVDIAQANPKINPGRLDVGQTIRLPSQQLLHRKGQTRPNNTTAVTYTVRPGDSLYTIAGEHYNSPNFWRVIYEANRDVIGSNPADLEAGMALVLPPTQGTPR